MLNFMGENSGELFSGVGLLDQAGIHIDMSAKRSKRVDGVTRNNLNGKRKFICWVDGIEPMHDPLQKCSRLWFQRSGANINIGTTEKDRNMALPGPGDESCKEGQALSDDERDENC